MYARIGLALPLSLGVWLQSAVANACGPEICSSAWVAPSGGSSVPANVPALAFHPDDNESTDQIPSLWTAGGDPVEVSVTADPVVSNLLLMVPTAPLGPSREYEIRFYEPCVGPPPSIAWHRFTTTQSAPLPTTVGNLAVKQQYVASINVSTTTGACVSKIPAFNVELDLQLSIDLLPYLPIARITTRVDGVEWASRGYGINEESLAIVPIGSFQRDALRVHAACPPKAGEQSSPDDLGVSLGVHTIEMSAHLAGAATDPTPVSVTADFRCDGVVADAAASTTPGATDVATDLDNSGCGCRLGGSARSHPLAILVALLAALSRRSRHLRTIQGCDRRDHVRPGRVC